MGNRRPRYVDGLRFAAEIVQGDPDEWRRRPGEERVRGPAEGLGRIGLGVEREPFGTEPAKQSDPGAGTLGPGILQLRSRTDETEIVPNLQVSTRPETGQRGVVMGSCGHEGAAGV